VDEEEEREDYFPTWLRVLLIISVILIVIALAWAGSGNVDQTDSLSQPDYSRFL
jgi:hypothetical protein